MMVIKILKYLIIILIVLQLISCDNSINDEPMVNQHPETSLFLYPDSDISQQKSRLHVHWWGDDSDGLITGYIFKWEGIDNNWSFTTSNDSIFALPIGTVDTSFTFQVSAIDNSGNGLYDESVFLNGIEIMHEPYIDENDNGKYDEGEFFFDFGAIDETPAIQKFPIKNTAPEVIWNDISILPERTFPAITVGWDASDLDGDETITQIHLALNDTSDYIILSGSTRLVSLVVDDHNNANPAFNVYINADENKLSEEKLENLRLDDNNRIYVRGVDNSGAKSNFSALPDTGRSWYIEKPKGELLIIDDYAGGENAAEFYRGIFGEMTFDNYNSFDVENTALPYETITFQNTLNLFKYIFWYSGSNPRLDLTNLITKNYLQNGGKIFYSMTFQDSSDNFEFSTQIVQTFLPLEEFENSVSFLFPGANIIPANDLVGYPHLETESTIGFVRTFKVSEITSRKTYDLTSSQLNGSISLMNNTKNLFFIGLPLHQCNANGNILALMQRVFIDEFGLQL